MRGLGVAAGDHYGPEDGDDRDQGLGQRGGDGGQNAADHALARFSLWPNHSMPFVKSSAASRMTAATALVTIAADRDEGVKDNGKAGSCRGEQAARRFGLQNPGIAVAIALSGSPGEAIDWLDVHLRDGPDTVRTGILDVAVPFEATDEERADAAEQRGRKAKLEAVAGDYPLPAMDSLTLSYRYTTASRVRVHKLTVTRAGPERSPVSTPFGIVARLRYADQGDAYGLRCAIQDMSGERRLIDIDRGMSQRWLRPKFGQCCLERGFEPRTTATSSRCRS